MTVEKTLEQAFFDLSMSQTHRLNIRAYLEILRLKHRPTYEHSIRVGVLCLRAAQTFGMNSRALFWGGTLHDIGKILVDSRVLQKSRSFSQKDYTAVRPHVIFGYRMLQRVYPYTAELVARHHRFQPHPYPKQLPKPAVPWPKRIMEKIEQEARLLSLMDFYDALTRRHNVRFAGNIKVGGQLRKIFYDNNPDMSAQIDQLIKNGIISF